MADKKVIPAQVIGNCWDDCPHLNKIVRTCRKRGNAKAVDIHKPTPSWCPLDDYKEPQIKIMCPVCDSRNCEYRCRDCGETFVVIPREK